MIDYLRKRTYSAKIVTMRHTVQTEEPSILLKTMHLSHAPRLRHLHAETSRKNYSKQGKTHGSEALKN